MYSIPYTEVPSNNLCVSWLDSTPLLLQQQSWPLIGLLSAATDVYHLAGIVDNYFQEGWRLYDEDDGFQEYFVSASIPYPVLEYTTVLGYADDLALIWSQTILKVLIYTHAKHLHC